MPNAAVLSTSGLVFTIPEGSTQVIIQNESDTAIRIRFGFAGSTTVTTTADANLGILLPAAVNSIPSTIQVSYAKPLIHPVDVVGITASGTKAVTYEILKD